MSKEKGLTKSDLDDLPMGSVVEDKDEDRYYKLLGDDGQTVMWVDAEQGEGTHALLLYGPLKLISEPSRPVAPATNERLIEVAQKVVDLYFFGDPDQRALQDALLSLNIELSTLKETP